MVLPDLIDEGRGPDPRVLEILAKMDFNPSFVRRPRVVSDEANDIMN